MPNPVRRSRSHSICALIIWFPNSAEAWVRGSVPQIPTSGSWSAMAVKSTHSGCRAIMRDVSLVAAWSLINPRPWSPSSFCKCRRRRSKCTSQTARWSRKARVDGPCPWATTTLKPALARFSRQAWTTLTNVSSSTRRQNPPIFAWDKALQEPDMCPYR